MLKLNYSSDTLYQLLSVQGQQIAALMRENQELKIKLNSYGSEQQSSSTHERKAGE
jgi:hypothetical protein